MEMWFFFFAFVALMALCAAMFMPVHKNEQDVPNRSYVDGVPVQGDALEPHAPRPQTAEIPEAPAHPPKQVAKKPTANKEYSQ